VAVQDGSRQAAANDRSNGGFDNSHDSASPDRRARAAGDYRLFTEGD
jgi:hypothetical protein